MALKIITGDITKTKADAIVNSANKSLFMGSGVSGAIFRAAGKRELQKECIAIGGCPYGEAAVTKAYKLDAQWIIHVVAPKWAGGHSGEEELLKKTYRIALESAKEKQIKTIAFPLIGGGINGFTEKKAYEIAIDTFENFLIDNDMEIVLVLFKS